MQEAEGADLEAGSESKLAKLGVYRQADQLRGVFRAKSLTYLGTKGVGRHFADYKCS